MLYLHIYTYISYIIRVYRDVYKTFGQRETHGATAVLLLPARGWLSFVVWAIRVLAKYVYVSVCGSGVFCG